MSIEDILKTYGKNDYYDMNTGKIYKLSEMKYHLFDNTTRIPVTQDGQFLYEIKLKGDLT